MTIQTTLSAGILCLLFCASLAAQDPLRELKVYPPGYLNDKRSTPTESTVESNVVVLDWMLEQKRRIEAKYTGELEHAQAVSESLDKQIEEIAVQLTQPMDKATLSRLSGRLMEELLDSRLELAVLEGTVDAMEAAAMSSTEAQIHKLSISLKEAAVQSAQQKVNLAGEEAKQAKKLYAKGSMSDQEVNRAEYSLKISMIELEAAQSELQIEKLQSKTVSSRELSDTRLKIAPIKARIKLAEEMFAGYQRMGELMQKIDKLNDQKKRFTADHDAISQQRRKVSNEIIELESLKELVEKRMLNRRKDGEGDKGEKD